MLYDRKEIDDSDLKAAFLSGDPAAIDREWNKWIAKLEAMAKKNPAYGRWFEQFCKDQERLLRWDETIGEDSDASDDEKRHP